MLAFRFRLNGRDPVTAGIPGDHVVSIVVSSVVRGAVAKAAWPPHIPFRRRELTLHVGGLNSDERAHVDWLNTRLKIGDKIVIDVVDALSVDPPRRHRPRKKKQESKSDAKQVDRGRKPRGR
jgi:hypothetical protein